MWSPQRPNAAPSRSPLPHGLLSSETPPDVSSAGPSLTGWLGVGGRKEAWCALRKTSLVYFNKKEDQDPTGAIALDSLCTVVPPEQTSQGAGRRMTLATKSVSFTLNTAKKQVWRKCGSEPLESGSHGKETGRRPPPGSLASPLPAAPLQWVLKTKTLSDANRWIAAIQDVIECCPRLTTKFEKYVNAVRFSGEPAVPARLPRPVHRIREAVTVLSLVNPLFPPLPDAQCLDVDAFALEEIMHDKAVRFANIVRVASFAGQSPAARPPLLTTLAITSSCATPTSRWTCL